METRQLSASLPPEIWLMILNYSSKRDIYALYFVSIWMHDVIRSEKLYSKAPSPWPARDYKKLLMEQRYLKQSMCGFKNGEVIFVDEDTVERARETTLSYLAPNSQQHVVKKVSYQNLNSIQNISLVKQNQFAILHYHGISLWNITDNSLTSIVQSNGISDFYMNNSGKLLYHIRYGSCFIVDPNNPADHRQIVIINHPTWMSLELYFQQGNAIIKSYDRIILLSGDGFLQKNISAEEILQSIYKTSISTFVQPISLDVSNLASIPPMSFYLDKFNFDTIPAYVLCKVTNGLQFLFNLSTHQSLYMGTADQIKLSGCLSTNDFFFVRSSHYHKCYEIYFGWNSNENKFEHTFYCSTHDPYGRLNDSNLKFNADQLIIDVSKTKDYLKVSLFNFKLKMIKTSKLKIEPSIFSDYRDPHGCTLLDSPSVAYEIEPLNDRFLIGHESTKWKYDRKIKPEPFVIWDNETGEIVYSRKITDYKIEKLEDGNLALLQGSTTSILRFGLFNQFDQRKLEASSELAMTK